MKTYFCSTWIITGSWYLNVVTFQHINIWYHWEAQQQCHFDIKLIAAFLRFEYGCYAICTWAYCKFRRKWCTKLANFSTLPCSNCFWVEYRYSLSPLSYTVYHFPYCAVGAQKGHGNVLILFQQRCHVGHSFRHFRWSGGMLVMRVVSLFLIILSHQGFVLY